MGGPSVTHHNAQASGLGSLDTTLVGFLSNMVGGPTLPKKMGGHSITHHHAQANGLGMLDTILFGFL